REFFSKDISNEKNLKNYYIVKPDDFVYNPRISTLAPVGPIKRNKLGRVGVMSPLYYVFRLFENIDYDYLEYYFQSTKWHKFMRLNGDSGARSDRFSIKNSVLITMPIPYPCVIEQYKIGKLFIQLNKMLYLHQRKINILKQIKKSYFNKMFPELNNNISSMRFRGFTTPWEDKKLNELFIKSGSGGTPRSNVTEYYNGDVPFLSITDITKSDGYIYKTDKKISKKGLENSAAWVVPAGSISLAMYASVGKIAILKIDVATSQAFYNMIFDNNLIRDFVYQSLSKANEFDEWNKFISTGTQKNLNAEKVKNFTIKIPPEELEIHEINQTLINFDTIIKKYKNKLCLLQNLKQQFLNKMFI